LPEKIANRTVSEEYFAVADQVDALYAATPATAACHGVSRLRRDDTRMLGNGWCTRPSELDCGFEAICEGCDFFTTGLAFRPTLQAQHDDAAAKTQTTRQQLYAQLLARLNEGVS
jgi:hypothetical protein